MEATSGESRRRLSRALLLALGIGFLWALFTLFAQASPSSAAQNDDDNGSGLLGGVTSTVNKLTGTVSGVVGTVDQVATKVVKAVEPVTRPIVKVAPKPVREAVASVAKGAVATVHTTTKAVDHIATTTLDSTLTAVSGVTSATPLGSIVGTPTALTPLLPTLGLDVVDPILGTAPVVPAPTSADPRPPAPAAVPSAPVTTASPFAVVWRAATTAVAAVTTAGVPDSLRAPGSSPPWGSVAPISPTGTFTLALGALAGLAVLRPRFSTTFFRHSGPDDDALPGAPVFETDTSPD